MIYNGIELPDPYKREFSRLVNTRKGKRNCESKKVKEYSIFYYNYTDEMGKRHQISTGKTTLKESKEEIIRRFENGTLLGTKNPQITFELFSQPFWVWDTCPIVKRKLRRDGHFSMDHCKNNRYQMEKHISPTFDHLYLNKITNQMIENWLDDLNNKELNYKTINNLLGIMRQMMEEGVRQNLITKNPCDGVVGYYIDKRFSMRNSFTIEQIRSLFEKTWDDKMSYVCCVLSSETGMRLCEIRGLMVEQIKEDHIEVNYSWNDVQGRKTTKNGLTRNIPITPELRDLILSISPEKGLIFTLNGTKPVKDTTITNVLKKEMEKRGMKYDGKKLSFHSFRKFYNTLLLVNNIQGDLIRSIMGHQSIDMTFHYLDNSKTKQDKELINGVINTIGWTNPYKEEDEQPLLFDLREVS